ncbi:MAG: hypothetical protein WCJ59_02250 [bacterium]
MKKNYTISLDEEKVDEIKLWLDKRSLTFSGYLNSLIEEQLSAMKLYGDGNEKVTFMKLMKLAAKMVGNLNESKK